MAEEENVNVDTDKKESTETTQKTQEELILGKFKDQEALKKAYQEAESSGSKMSTELKELKEFEKEVTPLLTEIYTDPELLKSVREKLGYTQTPTTETKKDNSLIPREWQQQMEQYSDWQRGQMIEAFEKRQGIDRLPDEQKKEVRKQIGSYLIKGRSALPPMNLLEGLLDDAYKLVRVDKLKEEGKLEGILESQAGNLAAIGSLSSGSQSQTEELTLTKEQKEVAKKAGLSEKEYSDYVKKMKG